jgi:hypothetical protein
MPFCTKCGADNPADGEFCYKCGRPLFSPKPEPAQERDAAANRVSAASAEKPSGIGGWLFLLCFSLAVGGPLSLIYQTVALLERGFTIASIVTCGIMLSIGTFSFVTGVKLWKKDRRAVRLATTFFYVMMVISSVVAIAGFASAMATSESTAAQQGSSLVGSGIEIFMIQLVWLLYLRKSARVKNTYQLAGGM